VKCTGRISPAVLFWQIADYVSFYDGLAGMTFSIISNGISGYFPTQCYRLDCHGLTVFLYALFYNEVTIL
jgi:hypothetical protein